MFSWLVMINRAAGYAPSAPHTFVGFAPPRPSLGNGAEIPREHVAPHRMSMTGDPDKTAQTTRARNIATKGRAFVASRRRSSKAVVARWRWRRYRRGTARAPRPWSSALSSLPVFFPANRRHNARCHKQRGCAHFAICVLACLMRRCLVFC